MFTLLSPDGGDTSGIIRYVYYPSCYSDGRILDGGTRSRATGTPSATPALGIGRGSRYGDREIEQRVDHVGATAPLSIGDRGEERASVSRDGGRGAEGD